MELDRALRVFKLYCMHFEENPIQAESLLLTDEEKQAILELKALVKEYGGLFERDRHGAKGKAA
jgi:hypothetical protein